MKKKSFTSILTLLFLSYFAIAGGKDDAAIVNECIRGKWVITKTHFQKNVTIQNITKVKQSNDQRKLAADGLEGGTITFTDKSVVYFTPAGDTTVYTGRVSYENFAGWSSDGSYGSKGGQIIFKFSGKGAKYNFEMEQSCPRKKKPNEFDGKSHDGYGHFHFERVEM